MYHPEKYDENSSLQNRDAEEFVDYLVNQMDFGANEKILDFGCGNGYTTCKILLPKLNKVGGKITAIDISEEMVNFARKKYKNPNISYLVANILEKGSFFDEKFDKIFSFHAIHWTRDQSETFRKFYEFLKPGGQIGAYFPSNTPTFSTYEVLSKIEKWKDFCKDSNNFISWSHFSVNQIKDMTNILKSIGFQVDDVQVCERKFTFMDKKAAMEMALAENPFLHRIPKGKLQDEFKIEFANIFEQFLVIGKNGIVDVNYKVFIIRASKLKNN